MHDVLHDFSSRCLRLNALSCSTQLVCELSDVTHVVINSSSLLYGAILAESSGEVVSALARDEASLLFLIHCILDFTLEILYLLALSIYKHLAEVVKLWLLEVL